MSMLNDTQLQGKHWLDLGCGAGTLSGALADRGATVLGVDASPKMIDSAVSTPAYASRVASGQLSFHTIENAEHLCWPDGTFDGIICSSVLEYLDSPERCLRECSRVLRPKGAFLLSAPNRTGCLLVMLKIVFWASGLFGRAVPEHMNYSRHTYTLRSLSRLLVACGLQPIGSRYYGPKVPRFLANNRLGGTLIITLAAKAPAPPKPG